MSCIKVVYNLCGFLTNSFSGRILLGRVGWASLVRTDRISFWLITLLVSHTSLSGAGSTGNIFMLLLFIPFLTEQLLQGRKRGGARDLGQWGTSVIVNQRLSRPLAEAALQLLCRQNRIEQFKVDTTFNIYSPLFYACTGRKD